MALGKPPTFSLFELFQGFGGLCWALHFWYLVHVTRAKPGIIYMNDNFHLLTSLDEQLVLE